MSAERPALGNVCRVSGDLWRILRSNRTSFASHVQVISGPRTIKRRDG